MVGVWQTGVKKGLTADRPDRHRPAEPGASLTCLGGRVRHAMEHVLAGHAVEASVRICAL